MADAKWTDPQTVRNYLAGHSKPRPMEAERLVAFVRLFESLGRPVSRFVDLGCGGGGLGRQLHEAFPHATCIYLDVSADMLQAARENAPPGLAPRSEFIQADFSRSGWQARLQGGGPVDAVVASFALHHQPADRLREVYAEILETLAPGGILANHDWIDLPSPALNDLHARWFVEARWQSGSYEGSGMALEEAISRYATRDDITEGLLQPLDTQCGWLREAGYVDVDCHFKMFGMALFGGRKPA